MKRLSRLWKASYFFSGSEFLEKMKELKENYSSIYIEFDKPKSSTGEYININIGAMFDGTDYYALVPKPGGNGGKKILWSRVINLYGMNPK